MGVYNGVYKCLNEYIVFIFVLNLCQFITKINNSCNIFKKLLNYLDIYFNA